MDVQPLWHLMCTNKTCFAGIETRQKSYPKSEFVFFRIHANQKKSQIFLSADLMADFDSRCKPGCPGMDVWTDLFCGNKAWCSSGRQFLYQALKAQCTSRKEGLDSGGACATHMRSAWHSNAILLSANTCVVWGWCDGRRRLQNKRMCK